MFLWRTMLSGNFFSQLKGRDLKDNHSRYNSESTIQRINAELLIEPTYRQKQQLKKAFVEEWTYYCNILAPMLSRYSCNAKIFLELPVKFEELFGEMCYHGVDLFNVKNLRLSGLAEPLKHKKFDEKFHILTEAAKIPAVLLPDTKKRIGRALLQFFIAQAKIKSDNEIINAFGELEYRNYPQTLDLPDITQKRHLQLHRSQVTVEYDEANDCSVIRIPNVSGTFTIPKYNLTSTASAWNTLIIHQENGIIPTEQTPWYITIKFNKGEEYLIKLRNKANRHCIFNTAKRDRFTGI